MVVANLVEVIREIRKKGMTILLADQNLKFCRRVCDRGYIIEKGRIVHEDTMEGIWSDEEIIQKYLVI
jgi:branched-chain amino acid transport system ATP-binding protein